MARLFWVCCPKKSQLSSSCNKQISKSAYYSLCSREQCLLSGICRFLGLVFCDFLAISLRMPFKNKFAIWGLILGLCFCRSPFLWRAIDFSFFEQVQIFSLDSWISSAPASLLFYFSAFLRVCSFVLCLYAFPAFPLFCFFPAFLLLCFSCFSPFCFPVFFPFFSCFAAFLLLCLSISTCLFLQSCIFMIFLKDKNMQTIPIFRVTFSRIWIVQAAVISRFPISPIPT